MNFEKIKYEVIPIFPTAVLKCNIKRSLTKKEIYAVKSYLINNETYKNAGNLTSKETYVFKNKKELKRIYEFCFQGAKTYFQQIVKPREDTSLHITQSWCNYSNPGDWHHAHQHPNSYISGVFYAETNDETDKIFFSKRKYEAIKVESTEFNPFNSDSWWLPVKTGDLIIFASSLEHYVNPVVGNKTRISIAFNTFLSGVLGSTNSLTELKL